MKEEYQKIDEILEKIEKGIGFIDIKLLNAADTASSEFEKVVEKPINNITKALGLYEIAKPFRKLIKIVTKTGVKILKDGKSVFAILLNCKELKEISENLDKKDLDDFRYLGKILHVYNKLYETLELYPTTIGNRVLENYIKPMQEKFIS